MAQLTKHYLTQLAAYAAALNGADSLATTFEIAIILTDTGAVQSRQLDRSDVEALLEWSR